MGIYSSLILGEPALQSYWQLGEASGNVADSKAAIAGTAAGTLTYAQAGYGFLGNAIRANGSTPSAINFGNNYQFSGTSNYTIEAWVNRGTASPIRLITKYDESLGNGWLFGFDGSNHLYAIRHWGASGVDVTGTTVLAASTYYHIAVTYDGTNLRLYVNGVLDATSATNTTSIASPNAWDLSMFASSLGSPGRAFSDVTMQHVGIYNTALTAAKLLSHYQAGGGLAGTGETGTGSESSSIASPKSGTAETATGVDTAGPVLVGIATAPSSPSVTDTFTDPDGTELSTHAPSSGSWTKVYPVGDPIPVVSINGGRAYASRSDGTLAVTTQYEHSLALADGWIKTDVLSGSTGGYLAARARSGAGGCYEVFVDNGDAGQPGKVWLRKVLSGTATQIGASYDLGHGTTSGALNGVTTTIVLECVGSALKVYVDGVLRITVTDTSLTTGVCGLHFYSPNGASVTVGARADNLSIGTGTYMSTTCVDSGAGTDTSTAPVSLTTTPSATDTGTGVDTTTAPWRSLGSATTWATRTPAGSTVLASAGGDGSNNYPYGAVMPNGDIRVWYADNAAAGTGTSLSTDNGATFGSHSLITFPTGFFTGTQYGGLAMVRRGRSGRYHAAVNRVQAYADGTYGGIPAGPIAQSQINFPTAVGNKVVYEPFYMYSDDGTTWSTPEAVAFPGGFAAVAMDATELSNGDIIVAWYGGGADTSPPYTSTGDYPNAGVTRKHAGSWTVLSNIAIRDQFGTGPADEPSLDVIHDGTTYGKIVCTVSAPDNGGSSAKQFLRSADGGTTWTWISQVYSGTNRGGICVGPDGDVIVTYYDGTNPVYRVSQNAGNTFSSATSMGTAGGNKWVTPFPTRAATVSPNVGVVWGTGSADNSGSSYYRALSAGATAIGSGVDTGTGTDAPGSVSTPANATVVAPPALATGDIPGTFPMSSEVAAPPADATGDLPAPGVTGSGASSATVTAVPADATGDLVTPALTAAATVTAPPADATGDLPAPGVSPAPAGVSGSLIDRPVILALETQARTLLLDPHTTTLTLE